MTRTQSSCEKSMSTLCRKSWVFSGFLPQGKLTGCVRWCGLAVIGVCCCGVPALVAKLNKKTQIKLKSINSMSIILPICSTLNFSFDIQLFIRHFIFHSAFNFSFDILLFFPHSTSHSKFYFSFQILLFIQHSTFYSTFNFSFEINRNFTFHSSVDISFDI